MNKVEVSRSMIGICHMQVCAESDATDEEILEVCRRDNPAGTQNNWAKVVREDYTEDDAFYSEHGTKPVPCEEYPGRLHFLVSC